MLLLIGSKGTVILQSELVIGMANDFMATGAAWLLWAVCVGLYAARAARCSTAAGRRPASRPTRC